MSQFYQQLATLTPEQRALLAQKLAAKGLEKGLKTLGASAIPSITDRDQPLPLSFAQQRLWFVQQLDPQNTAYNVASVLRLEGALDISALEKSLSALVERHETFRTHFELRTDENGQQQPVQVISSPRPVHLEVEACLGVESQTAVEKKIAALTQQPFDLSQPLLRTALLQVAADSYLLVLTTHHIISDRWSVMVFLREMTLLYRAFSQGQLSPLAPLKVQYADWAVWQRQQLKGEKLTAQIDYWQRQLSGELPVLDLPFDRSYGAIATYEGSQVPFTLSQSLSQKLKTLSRDYSTTLFTLLLTALKVLLHRYTNSDDVVIGSDIANRDRIETESLIGLLVNTLVFRSDLSNNPRFCDLLQQVRDTVLDGLAHKDLPFEKLVEVINPERHLSQMMPLFQIKLDLQQVDVKPMMLDGLTITRYPLPETQAKYELRLNLQDTPEGITGQAEYNSDLFDRSTILRMLTHFETLLSDLIESPEKQLSELSLLSVEEKSQLAKWNQTQKAYPTAQCVHQLFEAQVEKTPDAIAITDGQKSLSYAELNATANQLAHHLRGIGIRASADTPQTVGICLERSCEMVVALLATLKAGAAYVPLDPAYPSERLAFIAKDAQLSALLVRGEVATLETESSVTVVDIANVSKKLSTANLDTRISPKALSYIIYTSGSTGRPKGVAIQHRNTVALLHWAKEQFSSAELSGVLASTSICFDLSIFEIFVPLSWGGCVIVVENALALPQCVSPVAVSLLNTVPSILTQLLKVSPLPTSIQTVNLAGEALPVSLVQQLQQIPHVSKIYNLYGPSEDTTYSTCTPLHKRTFTAADTHVPIGRPIDNTQAHVLDRYGQLVPVGIAGELHLGGAGVAQGYLNRPKLTAEQFVSGCYKTGDRARYLPNGDLQFLGRLDNQVKIRGFRIEIGEIEAALCQQDEVQAAVVTTTDDEGKQLVAYVVVQKPAQKDALMRQLRHDLAQHLPAYLIPTRWVALDKLPQLPNGKVDRRALPKPDAQASQAYVAPRSALEKTLASIWRNVLNKEKIGIYDNFFELGGHSLLAIQIVAQAESELQRQVPLRAFFQSPCVAELAQYIEEKRQENRKENEQSIHSNSSRSEIEPDASQRHQPFPLTDIQQAYWIGRSQAFELGNIGTHGYREIEAKGLGIERIEQALNLLIERHDMLRAVVKPDGQQVILPEVPGYKIQISDLSECSKDERFEAFAAFRNRLAHQVFTPEQWPLFNIEAALLPGDKVRFFVSFDVLIGDAWSFQLLGKEMAQLIKGEALPSISLSFRDYVVAQQAFQETSAYDEALSYWQSRISTLPSAPALPLTTAPSQIKVPRFERWSGRLEAADWKRLKHLANEASLTPSGVVLAAFSEVLTAWSQSPRFTLNLTLFDRLPLHPEVNRIVGDFTASTLLAIDNSAHESFTERARRLQAQLWEDLDNRAVSGVRVLRELARAQANNGAAKGTGVLMPVVFTSTLNQIIPQTESRAWQTETVYSVSQTSQVYLDHQVSEIAGALVFNWDAIADLFPENLLDDMFTAYHQLLHQLAKDASYWQDTPRLSPTHQALALNQTQKTFPNGDALLHQLFFEQAKQQPEHSAVITPSRTLSYQEIAARSHALSLQIQSLGVQPNQLVAVSIEKGWQQVVAVLGILKAGAAYVPIDPSLPQARRQQMLADTAAEIVVTDEDNNLDWPDELTQLYVGEKAVKSFLDFDRDLNTGTVQKATDLAYIIYTSGSTGKPKGVMIDHRGAVNTILDINQRFGVKSSDRTFALSSLSFDLSVYDIFGTLAAGATIVIPAAEQAKNPTHWRQLLAKHGVTIWNTVPALMQLLVTALSTTKSDNSYSLRLALLSGDWIPLTLPHQIKQHFPAAQAISLGGATEAAIWSIFYPIGSIDPTWRSIPYGRPLSNQQWYVLDEHLQLRPPLVPGQLYIGGKGVAKGYWNRPLLTAERFIANPFADANATESTVLYKTGDLGRYLPDGNIEFLGREDFQVKVNGYRVELGEIESALQQYSAIEIAVVEAIGTPPELIAYVVPQLNAVENTLSQPLAKLDFKQQQLGIRELSEQAHEQSIVLPTAPSTAASEERFLRRQSHRQFLLQPIALASFSHFLSALSGHTLHDSPIPKYRYASAGSLYPIQTYIQIKESRIENLPPGWYYYHPTQHRLVTLSVKDKESALDVNRDLYGPNQQLHRDSAFSIFLVANMDAIAPIYGDKARDFCLIETGYIGQLLMEQAADFDLGLCPIGGFDSQVLMKTLNLSAQHQPLHALVGGAIDPNWNQQWMAINQSSKATADTLTNKLTTSLKQHLANKLPSYMVPTRYQILSSLPLTANGKVDRKALPRPQLGKQTKYIAPTTPTEERIVSLWQTLLETEKVGIQDNFFEIGGNSLSAMQLLSQLQNTFSIELTVTQLFGALTPALQAELIDKLSVSQCENTQTAEQQSASQSAGDTIPRRRKTISSSNGLPNVGELSDEAVSDLLGQLLATDSQEVSE
ncbi:MAG: amino acid adenylation domain-containing protein [Phormidesmis sp.]